MQVLKAETYNLGDDYITAYPKRLDQVTTRTVNQAAQILLVPAALRCAVIGDSAVLQTQLEPFGTLHSTKVE